MTRKIPLFYHIPKNAGTYVSDWFLVALRHYWFPKIQKEHNELTNEKDMVWKGKLQDLGFKTGEEYIASIKKRRNQIESKGSWIKKLQIIQNGFVVASLFIIDEQQFCENHSTLFIKKHTSTEWDIDLENVTTELLTNMFVFGATIEANGVKIREKILNLFKNYELHEFLLLRDSFSRALSLYNYLTSTLSIHEKTHGAITEKTFESFVLSERCEDSWLIRNLTGLCFNSQIHEHHFVQAVEILKKIKVYDIKETDKAIQNAFFECYGMDVNKLKLNSWDTVSRNNSENKKICFQDLSESVRHTFKEKTKWDTKLYNTFVP
jgi:hypothetical protein